MALYTAAGNTLNMSRFRKLLAVSFRAKVLVPVIAVMVLLLATMAAVINDRITDQFERDARRTLAAAEDSFQQIQRSRTRSLLIRFRDLKNEPRFREAFQSGDPSRVRNQLPALMGAVGEDVDIVVFSGPEELIASAKRDPLMSIANFESASESLIAQALRAASPSRGEATADTVFVDGLLYDVVSFPVFGSNGRLVGALTLGSQINRTVLEEFSRATHSRIVLLGNERVIVSTLPGPESSLDLVRLFRDVTAEAQKKGSGFRIRKHVLNGEHHFCAAGRFETPRNDGDLGYLLLYSYEQPLQDLAATQRNLIVMSGVAIVLGSLVVCFLVGKVTKPLRELRDSAEAVGRGDFSRRVPVRSQDECGELARVFNQMTENLKTSREQLETTVATLKSTQAQLIQSEKLSGIGQFIAGVAHELNNPLTSVLGFSELMKHAVVAPKDKHYLDVLNKSALRCQKIVQALLSFARRQSPERKPTLVNELIEASVDLLQYQLRKGSVKVITRFDGELPEILVDPHQMQQVFVNLLNNARQAIEASQTEGWIRIRTETDSRRVRIIFQDNGPGISPENLARIFDPFFTTKGVGEGTGLGLSLCYGIVKEHGGVITANSRPGEGATFSIELPLTERPAQDGAAAARRAEMPAARLGRGKRILVVDDEEPIRVLLRESLTPEGYEVDVAADGESGLRQLSGKHYDLMLCDWKMPGLNGEQVYERIRAIDPDFCRRIIFITGDIVSEQTRRFLDEQHRICLSKPFSLSEIHAALRRVMSN